MESLGQKKVSSTATAGRIRKSDQTYRVRSRLGLDQMYSAWKWKLNNDKMLTAFNSIRPVPVANNE